MVIFPVWLFFTLLTLVPALLQRVLKGMSEGKH